MTALSHKLQSSEIRNLLQECFIFFSAPLCFFLSLSASLSLDFKKTLRFLEFTKTAYFYASRGTC